MKVNLCGILFLFLFSGCNFIPQQPKITDLWAMQVGYPHASSLSSCNSCHESVRPATCANTFISLNKADHFPTQDCFNCHRNPNLTGSSWKVFDHKNFAGQRVADCTSCHEQNRPTLMANGSPHQATGTCGTCHIVPDISVNAHPGWLPAFMGHTPTPNSCLSCHAQDKPIGTVPNNYNGFDHSTMWGTECKTCHMSNVGVKWSGGYFDHGTNGSVVKAVTCSPCHDQRQHESGQLCSRCHSPQYPTGGAGGQWDSP